MSEPLASPRGCRSLAERSSSAAELMAPAEATTTSAEYVSVASPRFTTRRVTSRPDAPVSSFVTWASVSHVRIPERGVDADHLGVRLGPDQTRVAVAGLAADAAAAPRVGLVEHD